MEPLLGTSDEFALAADMFEKTYGAACIVEVYRANNPELDILFEALLAEITAKRGAPAREALMFHGTSFEGARGIIATGFDPAFSKIAAYGLGTYASPSARVAADYARVDHKDRERHVFICRFALGKHGVCGAGRAIDTTVADHSGNESNIFVTPYRYGIVPKYLIRYFK
jgi:lysine/ornithine N-monooxygenase